VIGKHRITIQHKTRVSDGEGGFIVDWVDLKEIWATVKPLKSYEKMQYMKIGEEVSHKVSMRYDPSIKSNHRIEFNHRILEIKGPPINVDEANKELQLTCIEINHQV